MPTETSSARTRQRRTDWRGNRRPVLVRLPEPLANQLCQVAEARHQSMSETAGDLIASALTEEMSR